MKNNMKLLAILLLCTGAVWAQDNGEKATVPLHDPSRPARIRAHLLAGSITVRGADINNVLVEARVQGHGDSHERHSDRAEGMHRLELPGNAGLDITEEDNVVNIKTATWNHPAELVITVPRHSSLELKSVNDGDIYVEQVDGEIDADDLNGKITLKNVSGSVVAHSLNGAVTASLDRIDGTKPMSFSTLNGDIDVTLPGDVRANVRMKTDNGDIYSDFDIKLNSGAQLLHNESGRQSDGSYRIRFDRTLHGTINGGGADYQFTTFNGQIYIRRRK